MVSRIGLRNVMCELRTCRMQIAHAGSRTRVTSMGGLYDTATLRALSSAVLPVLCAGVVMVVVIVLVLCVVLVRCSPRCLDAVVFVGCVAILRLCGSLCRIIVVLAARRRQTLHPPWGSNPRPQG